MKRIVTVWWWNDEHTERITFEKDMDVNELVKFMRSLENKGFEAVED